MEALTIKDNEKFLRQKSKVVDILKDIQLNSDIQILSEFCRTHSCFAMASVQLGIPKRIIYIKSTSTDLNDNINEQFILINPVIISQRGKTEFWEACVSGLDNFALVERPYEMTIRYNNVLGQEKIQKFEGFVCTVLSHELDHLDGIFHMDRAKKLTQMQKQDRIDWRKTNPYKIISKNCEFRYNLTRTNEK